MSTDCCAWGGSCHRRLQHCGTRRPSWAPGICQSAHYRSPLYDDLLDASVRLNACTSADADDTADCHHNDH